MDVAGLIPTPDAIPVHWGWLKFFLILTFVLHLLLMNLMLGGGLLALFGRLRGGAIPTETRSLPVLIALTVNLAIPPLLFVQTLFGHFLYSSSVLMAFFWLAIIPVLIGAYYGAYVFVHRHRRTGAGTGWLAIATLLLLFVGFMLTNNMTLMVRPERWAGQLGRASGTFLNLAEPTLVPRYLHFVIASVAIAALGRAVYLRVREQRNEEDHAGSIAVSLRIFAFMTMIQVVIGVLFWITLPGRIGGLFLGGSLAHTVHLWLGIALALVAIAVALRQMLRPTVVLAIVLVVDMVLVRDLVRSAYLDPYFSPADLQVAQQLSPMIVFLVALVGVTAVMAYVLREAWRARA